MPDYTQPTQGYRDTDAGSLAASGKNAGPRDPGAPSVLAALDRARCINAELTELIGVAEAHRAALRGTRPEPGGNGLARGLEKSPDGTLFHLRTEQDITVRLFAQMRETLGEIGQAVHGA